MAAAADLIVGLIEISEAGDEVALFIALESGTRNDVEDAVRAVSVVGVITSTLHFHVIDVFGIELRPDIAGDICVGDWHSIDQPAHLMAAANMKLIVSNIRAGNIFRNDCQAIGTVGARSILNLLAAQEVVGVTESVEASIGSPVTSAFSVTPANSN